MNGKSYDFKNCLIYVGQYSNGEISSGKGKKYDVNDILRFEAEYLNVER